MWLANLMVHAEGSALLVGRYSPAGKVSEQSDPVHTEVPRRVVL